MQAPRAVGDTPAAGQTKINPKDGAVMCYVPARPFPIGDNDNSDDNHWHIVTLSGYWMYKNDVTVAIYRKFCQPDWNKDDHPVVNVTWDEAKAYCDWAGVHLPTEAQ